MRLPTRYKDFAAAVRTNWGSTRTEEDLEAAESEKMKRGMENLIYLPEQCIGLK